MNLEKLVVIGLLSAFSVIGELDVLPLNTAVVASNTYVFYCAKPVEGEVVKVEWWDPNGRLIASNNKSANGYHVVYDQYRGHSVAISVFSIMEHSGLYECRASYQQFVYSGFAQLVVLDDYQLRCLQTSVIVVEGDPFEAVCEIGYAGAWAPLLEWSVGQDDVKIDGVFNEVDGTMARYRLSMIGHEGMADQFKCTGRFDQPKYRLPDNHASNYPAINLEPCKVDIIVHFPPTTERIKVSPMKDFYEVGERITCASKTNPPPSNIIWRDANGGVISHEPHLTAGLLGEYNYTCEVTNVVGDRKEAKTMTASKHFQFRVGPPTIRMTESESGVYPKRGRRRVVFSTGLAFGMLIDAGNSRTLMLAMTTWLGKETWFVLYTLPIWFIYFIFKRLYLNT